MANTGQILEEAISEIGDKLDGYGTGSTAGLLDLQYGGLNGVLPNIAVLKNGVVHGNWISNTPAMTGMVHAILLDYPKVFDFTGDENAKVLRGKLSNYITAHAEVIEGLNDTINLEYADAAAVGRTTEQYHQVSNATLSPVAPVISSTEKLGNPIKLLHSFWARYGIMDVWSGGCLAHLLPNWEKTAWTSDMQSMSILVYELDPTNTQVITAQIIANMMPKTTGEYVIKKDINAAKEVRKYSIEYTGFSMRGKEVIEMAQRYVDSVVAKEKDALLSKSLYEGPVAEVASGAIEGTLDKTAENQ